MNLCRTLIHPLQEDNTRRVKLVASAPDGKGESHGQVQGPGCREAAPPAAGGISVSLGKGYGLGEGAQKRVIDSTHCRCHCAEAPGRRLAGEAVILPSRPRPHLDEWAHGVRQAPERVVLVGSRAPPRALGRRQRALTAAALGELPPAPLSLPSLCFPLFREFSSTRVLSVLHDS